MGFSQAVFDPQPIRRNRIKRVKAFTLVEMLVVIAIIGILTAILVPVIGGALRRASEFAIIADMNNIETALEGYKAKTSVYPTDFLVATTFVPQVSKLSGRAETANLGSFLTTALANPHVASGLSTVANRTPNTIDAAEGWVFWMFETTADPKYPLGAEWNGTAWVADSAAKRANVWDPKRFMEFDLKRLTDVDGDGWFEYVAPRGPQKCPYVYFDARTYEGTNPDLARYNDGPTPPLPKCGTAMAYNKSEDATHGNLKWFQKKYQLINCGLDNNFGAIPGAPAHKVLEIKENIVKADRDNICNFTEGRLDSSFDD